MKLRRQVEIMKVAIQFNFMYMQLTNCFTFQMFMVNDRMCHFDYRWNQ
ncbi:MAG: hypothetical protein WBM77_08420 [Maribacter sp.]